MAGAFHLGGHHTGLDYHRVLLDDDHRVLAYERAIRTLVRPGDVVLDLGAGTGVLSLLAARRGAARVHAVESMKIASLARALASANGLDDRVLVHEADARTLPPVEPVDLVVSDFLGRFVVDDGMLEAVRAAAAWMKPGARFCPSEVRLSLGPVTLPLRPVSFFERPLLGLDLGPAREIALHTCYHGDLDAGALLAPAQPYHELVPPVVSAPYDREVRFAIERPGLLRAVAGWFVATLAPGVELSTAPGQETHWGQYLFPVPAVSVEPGDTLRVHLWLEEGVPAPVWRWEGALERGGAAISTFSLHSEQRLDQPGAFEVPRGPVGRAALVEATRRGGEAFVAARFEEAARDWLEALRATTLEDDELLAPLYENLGLAWLNLGELPEAARDFSRALDGVPASREQSLRFLVLALARLGRHRDGVRALRAYEEAFGPHPDGLTLQPVAVNEGGSQ